MKTLKVWMNQLPAVMLLVALLLAGISTLAPSQQGALEPHFTKLATTAVGSLPLSSVGAVRLGDKSDTHLAGPIDAVFIGRNLYVLDGITRSILQYDVHGALVRRLTTWGYGDGELATPVRIQPDHDTLLVLDVTHPNAVSAFGPDGRFLGSRFALLDNSGGFASFALLGRNAVIARFNPTSRSDRPTVVVVDHAGREIAAGCPEEPGYGASGLREGMLAHFAMRDVVVRNGRILCSQAITPVITVLDLQGHIVDHISVAPPFYEPPVDMKATMNQKKVMEFQSRWFALARVFATPAGFVAAYSRYDGALGRLTYQLFSCDLAVTPNRCRVGSVPGTPVRFVAPDTLLTFVSAKDGTVSLNILKIGQ